MTRIAVIINGISRKKKIFYNHILPLLSRDFSVSVFETEYAGHALDLAAHAAREQFDYLLAAGGDGTLNQALNGILKSGVEKLPTIGVIPLGTGNDFARTCGLSTNPEGVLKLIKANRAEPTDVGKLISRDDAGGEQINYFMNCCSVGMGPEVVRRLLRTRRTFGAGITYIKAIVATFLTMKTQEISCVSMEASWQGKVRVFAVANGRSFGNKIYIAPDANINDGLLNVFIAGDFSLIRFLRLLSIVKAGKKANDTRIKYITTTSIAVTSPLPCTIETEGELAGNLPVAISVLPSKILFLREHTLGSITAFNSRRGTSIN